MPPSQPARPRPCPDDLTRPYWQAASQHRLIVMSCSSCGQFRHPPRSTCERCGSGRYRWEQLSGEGRVWSFVVDHRNLIAGFDGPYVVALVNPVETGDDVRIVSNVVGCAGGDVYVGMRVKITWEDVGDGLCLPQFTPADPLPGGGGLA